MFRPHLDTVYSVQDPWPRIRVETCQDFAGDLLTRTSTSGAVMFYRDHLVKATPNLRSRAERRSTTLAFIVPRWRWDFRIWDLGARVELATDSDTAEGFASRRGIGRAWHIATGYSWLKEMVSSRDLSIDLVSTADNRALALTKPMGAAWLHELVCAMGLVFTEE